MEGLRLALATDTYHPQINGVARTLHGLVREVARRGGQARVFTTTDPSAPADASITRFGSVPFWAYPQLRIAPPPTARMIAELRGWSPTLVHAATPFGVGLAARAAAKALGIRFVTSYHTSLSAYAKFYRLGALAEPGWKFLRWFHNSGDLTFVPSRPVADELAGRGFSALRLWGRGVDCVRFSPRHRSLELRRQLGFRDEEVVALYVGRIAREKGLADLLEAMQHRAAAPAPAVRYLIVGDGPYEADMRARAPNDVVFMGRREGAELAALFASSDIFVFPSMTDTFGNVLLEAMASALAIVAADAPSTRSLAHAAGAVFYTPLCAAELASRIRATAASPVDRYRHASLGLREAQRHSWDRVFDDLFAAYRDVAAQADRVHNIERRQTPKFFANKRLRSPTVTTAARSPGG